MDYFPSAKDCQPSENCINRQFFPREILPEEIAELLQQQQHIS